MIFSPEVSSHKRDVFSNYCQIIDIHSCSEAVSRSCHSCERRNVCTPYFGWVSKFPWRSRYCVVKSPLTFTVSCSGDIYE